jgi:anthranilate/para-aminobenzoate synthase component I
LTVNLCSSVVHAPADPSLLARRIWRQEGAVFLWSANGLGRSFIACDPIATSGELDPEPDLPWGATDSAVAALSDVPRWVGVLPYEATRERLERPAFSSRDVRAPALCSSRLWYRYGAVAVIEKDDVYIVGDDERRVQQLRRLLERPSTSAGSVATLCDDADEGKAVFKYRGSHGRNDAIALEDHRARVRRAIELIREGDLYQVNLARRLDFDVAGDVLSLLLRMSERVKAPYAAAFELAHGLGIVSTSPELMLRTDVQRRVLTEPIKGTRRLDSSREQQLRTELEFDPKERAELSMVVDIERNDIGRIATVGSVIAETPRVISCDTVLHRVARVRGVARSDVTRSELLTSMLPSGSVTGAPKVRAMEWIAALETDRRGLYTGALGYLSHNGCLNLGMAIRCLVRRGNVGHYHVGGGIVVGSDPERELEETFWKAQQVLGSH